MYAATISFFILYKRRATFHNPIFYFITMPAMTIFMCVVPLIFACAYSWSVKHFHDQIYIQAFIVTCVFPGVVTVMKILVLSKRGSRVLFGRKFHLAEDFEKNRESSINYTNTVRLVHTLNLLQIVGVFATLHTDVTAFLASSFTKVSDCDFIMVWIFFTHFKIIFAPLPSPP